MTPETTGYGPALDALPLLAWVAAPDGALEYLNPRCREYAGLPLDDLLGWDWKWVVHPADLPATLTAWSAALRSGMPLFIEQRLRRADGEFRWFEARAIPTRDATGRIVRWFGVNADVDDAKRAEAQLRATQALFRALVERSEDGFALVGSDRTIRYASPGVGKLLGHRPEVMTGTGACEWVHPTDRPWLSAKVDTLLTTPGERLVAGVRLRHANGSYVRIEFRATNLLPDPDVRGVTISLREVGGG